MKVTIGKHYSPPGEFTVIIEQGIQRFSLDYQGTKEEARWLAMMFRIALKNHDKEKKHG